MTFKNLEGQRIPNAQLFSIQGGRVTSEDTGSLFANRTVVVFALPGAFTPTCSSTHLPRYEELAAVFKQQGVDDIVCLSVNDPYVMDAWGRAQSTRNVRLLGDGNGEFSEAMGMLVDKHDLGFGKRSWRYSMLVVDGRIEKMFIEPDVPGDPFQVSDADTMLRHLAPEVERPAPVTLFSRPGCPHCARAREALDAAGWRYEEIVLGRDASTRSLEAVSGATTTPQVFVGGQRIGGADELLAHLAGQADKAVA